MSPIGNKEKTMCRMIMAFIYSCACFKLICWKDFLCCSINGFVYLQAERELQPWIAKDDEEGQKMWKINQRIVKVMVELMRNHDRPESLVILASASDLLLRATDGMLVDGEACTLPQLEVLFCYRLFYCAFRLENQFSDYGSFKLLQLLEATARAIQPVLAWGPSGLAVVDGLSNLLKVSINRTEAMVSCGDCK